MAIQIIRHKGMNSLGHVDHGGDKVYRILGYGVVALELIVCILYSSNVHWVNYKALLMTHVGLAYIAGCLASSAVTVICMRSYYQRGREISTENSSSESSLATFVERGAIVILCMVTLAGNMLIIWCYALGASLTHILKN